MIEQEAGKARERGQGQNPSPRCSVPHCPREGRLKQSCRMPNILTFCSCPPTKIRWETTGSLLLCSNSSTTGIPSRNSLLLATCSVGCPNSVNEHTRPVLPPCSVTCACVHFGLTNLPNARPPHVSWGLKAFGGYLRKLEIN